MSCLGALEPDLLSWTNSNDSNILDGTDQSRAARGSSRSRRHGCCFCRRRRTDGTIADEVRPTITLGLCQTIAFLPRRIEDGHVQALLEISNGVFSLGSNAVGSLAASKTPSSASCSG